MNDIVHEMTLYAKRDPEPYVRWAGEVIELKQRIRELESAQERMYHDGFDAGYAAAQALDHQVPYLSSRDE